MKVTGYVTGKAADNKSATVAIKFLSDDETETLHSFTVIVDNPDIYYDHASMVKFGAYPKLLNEIIPQMQDILTTAMKTDAQIASETGQQS